MSTQPTWVYFRVPCPACRAERGSPCTAGSDGGVLSWVHKERIGKFDAQAVDVEFLKADLASTEKERDHLRAEVAKLQEDKRALERTDRFDVEREGWRASLKKAAKERDALTKLLDTEREAYETLRQERDQLKRHLDEVEADRDNIEDELLSEREELEGAKQRIANLEKERDQLRKLLDTEQEAYETLRQERDQLKAEVAELQAAHDDIKDELDKERESWRAAIDQMAEESTRLSAMLRKEQAESHAARQERGQFSRMAQTYKVLLHMLIEKGCEQWARETEEGKP